MIAAGAAHAELGDALNGAWEGSLSGLSGAVIDDYSHHSARFRITIAGDEVHVFTPAEQGAGYEEVKPGDFHIVRLGNSALIHALDNSPAAPLGQGWVESWNLSVTLDGADTLACVFTRQVNNHQMRPDESGAVFSAAFSGELHRVGVDHV